jgi:outer membrane protein TolC
MKRLVTIVFVVAFAVPASAQPAPQTPPADQPVETPQSWLPGVTEVHAAETATPGFVALSMARAVEIAQHQNPNVRIQAAAYDAALGKVELARVPLHPTVLLSASANALSQPCSTFGSLMGSTASCGYFSIGYTTPLSATAKWTIWDFGLTRANTRAADLNASAQRATIDTTGLDTRQSVELAYLSAIAQHKLVVVADATVKSESGHLNQAKLFVQNGAQDPIAVVQAQSRFANAKAALAQAQSSEATAIATLRAAIGYLDPTRQIAIDPNWPMQPDDEPPALPGLVDAARQHRPELKALQLQIDAANASLDAAHYERMPTLSAIAQTQWVPGTGNWSPQPSWSAGITLSWLAWDGGKSRADVHVARANLQVANATKDQLLVSMISTLESARAQIVTSRAAVQASTEAVASAREQLRLAEARYKDGLGSQIELADAQTAVTTAEGNLVTSDLQLASAWTSLRRQIAQ